MTRFQNECVSGGQWDHWYSCLNAGLVIQSWGFVGFFYLHLASVPCDLGEFHTLLRASVWVLLLHYAETAIKQDSLVATFPFMFSSMSRCWYKLPPRVTLQILNTCLALINSSQVFQAPWKCYPSFFIFFSYQLPCCQFDSLNCR